MEGGGGGMHLKTILWKKVFFFPPETVEILHKNFKI